MSIATRSIRGLHLASLTTRSFHLATIIEEDIEQCDFPALNLGTESLASTPKVSPTMLSMAPGSRPRSLSMQSMERQRLKQANARRTGLDRDCMICFYVAQRPSRTKCCGKLFCETHLHDWLAGSSNRCPSCSAYCHPKTDVLSLASPASPTVLSPQTNLGAIRHTDYHNDEIDRHNAEKGSQSRCRSRSPSSPSSSDSSLDLNTDQDDEDNSAQTKVGFHGDSLSLQSFVVKLIRYFLDDPPPGIPELYPVHQAETKSTELRYLASSSSLPSAHPSPQLHAFQMILTPSYRSSGSEVVNDTEMTTVALAGKVIGKVLSIIALMLIFWILAS
ncbi:hypothetical protein J3R30DRAFT_3826654 [Lentinula aciculospora]|uniref:RING-type domain-containing protein n=1 Tax=Lentinula aciculospora TaxID=153920 RepID=A0A9W8ZXN2_9AGAR|nr:hypothetical protein J3R30DRAFT_3826654 [Lentinula aciculospora]